MLHAKLLLPLLGCALTAALAQDAPRRHVTGVVLLAAGQGLDLDSGVILTQGQRAGLLADLTFSRGPKGFLIRAAGGALQVEPGNQCARAEDLEARAWPLRTGQPTRTQVFFLRTDKQHFARVEVGLVAPYGAGVAQVRYAVNTWGTGWFPLPPNRLEAEWNGQALGVRWRGPRGRWRVTATSGDDRHALVTEKLEASFTKLKPRELYRIEVVRELPDGEVSLPARGTWLTARAAARRGVIELPDRWYDQTGGLDLATGSRTGEDPDVLLYLYGVSAPGGGGVRKLGVGADVYRMTTELPERGYLPVHGRLDEEDVLAVRLADGRFAKLLLEPMKGDDLRRGMRVHFAMLTEGGRSFMAPPENGRFSQLDSGGVELRWTAVEGVARYVVTRADSGKPVGETDEPRLVVPRLPIDRVFRFAVTAKDARGNTSDPLILSAHTYPEGAVMGRLQLDCHGRNGAVFSRGTTQDVENTAAPPEGLELRITNSAGGASSLRFGAPFGIRAAGELPFGNLDPHPADRTWKHALDTDSRSPRSNVFLVRTEPGGLASVRIVRRRFPEVELEYIVAPPPFDSAVLRTWILAAGVKERSGDREIARGHIRDLADPDKRKHAFEQLRALGGRAAPAIQEALERLPELPLRRPLERLARALIKSR